LVNAAGKPKKITRIYPICLRRGGLKSNVAAVGQLLIVANKCISNITETSLKMFRESPSPHHDFYNETAKTAVKTGFFVSYQSYGDLMRWNPHLHCARQEVIPSVSTIPGSTDIPHILWVIPTEHVTERSEEMPLVRLSEARKCLK